MTGIYKIVSPSGRVYIGQTRSFERRLRNYRKLNCKGQVSLYNSLRKYGFSAHNIQLINELPDDISQEDLDKLEILYIEQYRRFYVSMNIADGGVGSRGKRFVNLTLEESTSRRERMLGNRYSLGYKQSEETKRKRLESRFKNRRKLKLRLQFGLHPYK